MTDRWLPRLAACLLLAVAWTARAQDDAPPAPPPVEVYAPVALLRVEVLETRPHDPSAFTQGLLLDDDGRMFESTGLYGESTLREVDPLTGEVLRQAAAPETVFGEGLALVEGRLFQLTWREGGVIVWDEDTFTPLGALPFTGEGWGLCYDGEVFHMSNGSASITTRDVATFAPLRRVTVTLYGLPVANLNELECVDDQVYANVWETDTIVRFDAATGVVNTVIDARVLFTLLDNPPTRSGSVLNGIAYDPASDTFLLTGKLWPSLFVVRFVPIDAD